ncbi:MAG TPA: hypothetical protein VMB49_04180 [Acidobacteriaceae bacterium]|nr:hypothetical protein [Acidobacteriaceae bacterium]
MSSIAGNLEPDVPVRDLRMCWWSFAARGVLAVVFAVVLFLASSFLGIFFFDPVTLVYMSLLLGSFVLSNGLLLGVAAFFSWEHHIHVWWLVLCESVFTVLLGVYIGVSLLLTPQSFAFLAGIHGLGAGCFQIALAMKMRGEGPRLIHLAFAGLISLGVGIGFLTHYNLAPRITTQILSGYELFAGIVWIVFAARLRGKSATSLRR